MQYILKGITGTNTIESLKNLKMHQFSFDLRPRSFNFTQIRKINEMIKVSENTHEFSLCFENEKEEMITELYKKAGEGIEEDKKIFLEFCGAETLDFCEKISKDYIWHYHQEEKIANIANTKYLKRIVFKHKVLEEYHKNNELHGFLNLFADFGHKVYFEIQLDWENELILSLFDFFQIPVISYEINQKVEKSYQQPDHELIEKYFENINVLLNK